MGVPFPWQRSRVIISLKEQAKFEFKLHFSTRCCRACDNELDLAQASTIVYFETNTSRDIHEISCLTSYADI